MTNLFNLCEYEYFLAWQRLAILFVPNIQWEHANQELHIYLSLTTIQIKIPVICSRYNESAQEIHDDGIPF
jgi:hypothetical protein